ncbi:MAG TPA: ABC transporter permease subunit [Dehalococcoidia bacterium]|jgi:general L-amino acid transport system permease protein|nr:ABC transporter permease subunit [Dehalococcoidia bacterium]
MAAAEPARGGRFLRSRRSRSLAIQAGFSVLLLLLLWYVVDRASQLELDFDFLNGPAGFAISHTWLIEFDSSDSRIAAYLVAVTNTLRLILVGILLATVIGVLAGVARLSDNWLVSRIAAVYVEVVRNTPLLVQIVFWYTAIFLKLPRIEDERSLFGFAYLSNRSLALPWPEPRGDFFLLWVAVVAIATVPAYLVRRRRARREAATGQTTRPNLYAVAVFLGVALVAYLALGLPVEIGTPTIVRQEFTQSYVGGLSITPEFAAMLFALVAYTGSFIAEIVRGSIQALPRGQGEAAMAIGLTGYQRTTLVILPQALRSMIPSLTNEYLNLTKNSSLAAAIAYADLFQISEIIINKAGHAVVMFMVVIATYQIMSFAISGVMSYINRRVQLVGS